jgi:hypothetical protein
MWRTVGRDLPPAVSNRSGQRPFTKSFTVVPRIDVPYFAPRLDWIWIYEPPEELTFCGDSGLKIARTAVAIAGLVAIALTYATGIIYLLVVGVALFFIGLYLMGANRKPVPKQKEDRKKNDSSKRP